MGAGWFYDTRNQPSESQIIELKQEVAVIKDRQNQVLVRLAVLETEILTLQDRLEEHEQRTSPQANKGG